MKFIPLTAHDFSTFQPYFTNQQYLLCVYSLSSIIAWRHDGYQPYAAVDNGALIICGEFTKQKENRHLILPVSPHGDYSPEELRDLAVNLGHTDYWFIPESYLERFGTRQVEYYFDIIEQKKFHDYVYMTADLAHLKGNKYSKKRNLINQFVGRYVDKGRVRVETLTPDILDECKVFLNEWCRERGCDEEKDEDINCERQALLNAVTDIELLQMKGIILRIDDKLNALGIASPLTQEMAALHFEKAFATIKGLYQYFDRECARRLFNGYQYLNKESDMGVPGLAKAKKSYHPVMFVKSYQLRLKA